MLFSSFKNIFVFFISHFRIIIKSFSFSIEESKNDIDILDGEDVSDKIIGHGAAVLLVHGGARNVITHVVSKSGLLYLKMNGVNVTYDDEVDHILNREKKDWCPLEKSLNNIDDIDIDDLMEIIAQNVENTEPN